MSMSLGFLICKQKYQTITTVTIVIIVTFTEHSQCSKCCLKSFIGTLHLSPSYQKINLVRAGLGLFHALLYPQNLGQYLPQRRQPTKYLEEWTRQWRRYSSYDHFTDEETDVQITGFESALLDSPRSGTQWALLSFPGNCAKSSINSYWGYRLSRSN